MVKYIVGMLVQAPSPLAAQVAAITAGIRAESDLRAAEAGLIAALQALILATLARLFSRLESLIELWAAGQLPIPAHTPHRRATAPARPRPNSVPAPRARRAIPRPALPLPAPSATTRPQSVPRPIPPARRRARQPSHPLTPGTARPPTHFLQNPPCPPHLRTPYLFRYRN